VKPSLPIEIHRPVTWRGQRAIDCLLPGWPLDPAALERCFRHGAVWWQTGGKPKRLRDPAQPVKPGHRLHLYCNRSTLEDCPLTPRLIADFGRYSAWDKPAGLFSQGSKWGDHWTLHRWIRMHHWPEREALCVHRLDRHTRGLMLVAHDAAANAALHRLFERGEVAKTYLARVRGAMTPGTEKRVDYPIDGRPAVSLIRVLDSGPGGSLVEIRPQTGRKHQIRRHLAELGHPVINDRLHGHPPFDGDLQLEAIALELTDPFDRSPRQIRLESRLAV
jgi:tRNA pseudouridine32 synthase/23S rRNA pseudouridine746 synthase